jgi:hypothetical protein
MSCIYLSIFVYAMVGVGMVENNLSLSFYLCFGSGGRRGPSRNVLSISFSLCIGCDGRSGPGGKCTLSIYLFLTNSGGRSRPDRKCRLHRLWRKEWAWSEMHYIYLSISVSAMVGGVAWREMSFIYLTIFV